MKCRCCRRKKRYVYQTKNPDSDNKASKDTDIWNWSDTELNICSCRYDVFRKWVCIRIKSISKFFTFLFFFLSFSISYLQQTKTHTTFLNNKSGGGSHHTLSIKSQTATDDDYHQLTRLSSLSTNSRVSLKTHFVKFFRFLRSSFYFFYKKWW